MNNSVKTKGILFELFSSFFKIGILTFGGGLAMLPMLKREVVEHQKWATEEELLDIYAIGQCTPGIIAVNTATYIGFQEAGYFGGVIATLGVVTPSIIIICLVASVLKQYVYLPTVQHALSGIRIAVCAMMVQTVVTMTQKGVKDLLGIFLFLGGFLVASFTPVPLPAVVVASAAIGVFAKRKGGKEA